MNRATKAVTVIALVLGALVVLQFLQSLRPLEIHIAEWPTLEPTHTPKPTHTPRPTPTPKPPTPPPGEEGRWFGVRESKTFDKWRPADIHIPLSVGAFTVPGCTHAGDDAEWYFYQTPEDHALKALVYDGLPLNQFSTPPPTPTPDLSPWTLITPPTPTPDPFHPVTPTPVQNLYRTQKAHHCLLMEGQVIEVYP